MKYTGPVTLNLFFVLGRTPRPNAAANLGAPYVKRRGFAQRLIFSGAANTRGTNLGAFYPQNPKIGPGIGFSMLNSKSNYVRTVRDRKVIPSANPTKSRTANQTKVMPLTLD